MNDTRQQLLVALRRDGALSLDQLVPQLGVTKTAVRKHMLALERVGAVRSTKEDPVAPGRPRLLWTLTEAGAERFPTREAEFLRNFVSYVEELDKSDILEGFFRELWAERMREFRSRLGDRELQVVAFDVRLKALHDTLEDGGFMPRISVSEVAQGQQIRRRVTVEECNCPLAGAARASRIPCRLEAGFLQDVLGGCSSASPRFATMRSETCTFQFDIEQ